MDNFNVYEGFLLIVIFILSASVNCILYAKILRAVASRSIPKTATPTSTRAVTDNNRIRNQVARTLIINGVVCQIPYCIDNLDDAFEYLHLDVDLLDQAQDQTVTTIGQELILSSLTLFLTRLFTSFALVITARE